jgi:hypothetical protein
MACCKLNVASCDKSLQAGQEMTNVADVLITQKHYIASRATVYFSGASKSIGISSPPETGFLLSRN